MAGTSLSLPGFCSFPVNRRTTTALRGPTLRSLSHHQETAARQQAWSQARSSALRIRPSTVPFSTLWTVFQSMSPPRSSTLPVFRWQVKSHCSP